VREAVKEVLTNPLYRKNAKRIQADFAKHDAPKRAVELLEALIPPVRAMGGHIKREPRETQNLKRKEKTNSKS
jgi:hypothetical protein